MSNWYLGSITEEQFQAYEDVRVGGLTNMWDTRRVSQLSGGILTMDTALEILKHYRDLNLTYPEVCQSDDLSGRNSRRAKLHELTHEENY